jgi:predicted phosphodiesterase
MRYAIFSDVHNHTQALRQVLADARQRDVSAFFCLGDIGIDECVDIIRESDIPTVFGNWEASNWKHLSPKNQGWILARPPIIRKDGFWLTHAGPFWPNRINSLEDLNNSSHISVKGSLFPYLHFEGDSLWETIALLIDTKIPLMFHGHSHRQLAWRFTRTNKLQRLHPQDFVLVPGETYVVGVGSVGRPLDGPGASYVIYDAAATRVEMLRLARQ